MLEALVLLAALADTKTFDACMDKAGGVTASMLDCIGAETDRQDARLNAAYKKLMGTLAPGRQASLKSAQRLWIGYRDANCAFRADPDGGTLAGVTAADCVLTMTRDRAQELEGLTEE
jgi:uncharacterized protein YecT (DUF1311 family)